jgi:AraC-like DNA-binding protein
MTLAARQFRREVVEQQVYTINELATMLGLSRRTVIRLFENESNRHPFVRERVRRHHAGAPGDDA